MNKIKLLSTFIAVIAGLGAALVVLILIANDLAWQGKLEAETDFLQFSPYFSILKPQDRVVMSDSNYIKAEPIYFDLYLPRDFAKARIDFEYEDEYGYDIFVGPNIKESWELKPLEDLPSASNDYKIKRVEFELADKNVNQGKLRFMISIPDLDNEEQGLDLRKVRVLLTRKPIWQDNIKENILTYLKYVKNQF